MKIAVIAHLKHPVRAPFAGGLEAFTHAVTKSLIASGHDVTLFASAFSDPELNVQSILTDRNYDPSSGERLRDPDLSSEYIEEHHAYQKLMLDIDEQHFDVIFNNCLHYVPVTMANVIRTPMLYVLHTPPFYELKHAIRQELRSGRVRYATVSQANATSWSSIIPEIDVVYNGIDLNAWTYFPKGQQKNYAAWFGRIHPDKGVHLAIQAAQKAGIPLKIAGSVSDKRYFKKLVEPLLNDQIELIGHLDHAGLNTLIGEARVSLVTPSWQEPFGLVVAESLACGTPVAGFTMGALPELVNEDSGKLVECGDTDALAAAIGLVCNLDREHIRQYAEDQFSFTKMMGQYEKLLCEVAASQHAIVHDV